MTWSTVAAALVPAPEVPALEATLERAYREGSAATGGLAPAHATFARLLYERLQRASEAGVDAAEIVLAAGCADGEPAALAFFEREYLHAARASLAHLKLDAHDRDDILQRVRQKLLLPRAGGARPVVCDYAGDGRLKSLLRVIASREAVSLLRARHPERLRGDDTLAERAGPAIDPGVRELVERAGPVLKRAFASALAELEARDRNLLRLHLLDGVTVDALAKLYQVHRVTASRWMSAARAHIAGVVRARLAAELGLADTELESLCRHAESQLDLSVERLLRDEAG